MKKYTVIVTLFDQLEAEDADGAYDLMMDLIAGRDGMEISSHEVIEDEE